MNQIDLRGEISDLHFTDASPLSAAHKPDLINMAARALCYLRNNPMPGHGYQCRFSFAPLECPPLEPDTGWWNDTIDTTLVDPVTVGDTESRNDIAFSMMREITGDMETGRREQEAVHSRLLGYIREDARYRNLCWVHPYCYFVADEKTYAMYWCTGKLLESECRRYELEPDTHTLEKAKQLFEGIRNSAQFQEDAAYYPYGGAGFNDDGEHTICEWYYPLIMGPLCAYWQTSNDERCLDLLNATAKGFLRDLQPSHCHRADGGVDGHNHSQLHALRGMAQFGYLAHNGTYLKWARDVYEYYRKWSLDTGWLPEIRDLPDHSNHSETCLNSDMLEMEVWFALAGEPAMWDRVDRAFRNYFCPAQFVMTAELENLYRRVNSGEAREDVEAGLHTLRELEGGFISALTPNDRIFPVREEGTHWGAVLLDGGKKVFDMMGCCPPEGMRALYLVWKYSVTEEDDRVYVHLPYDRNHSSVEVYSELPERGQLTVIAKRACEYLIRVPCWAPKDRIRAKKNGQAVCIDWDGPENAYVRFRAEAGDRLYVNYPLLDVWQRVEIRPAEQPPQQYDYHWIGNSVVDVQPQGVYMPLYKDAVY